MPEMEPAEIGLGRSRAAEATIPARRPRVVAMGGGTGLPVLLSGLKALYFNHGRALTVQEADRTRLTAVVTTADDGGSSGLLRKMYGIAAPGDIRNCLLALSDAKPALRRILNYRFDSSVGNHSLGNLMLTALTLLETDFFRAVEGLAEVLEVRGQVWPAFHETVNLSAVFEDGTRAVGESAICSAGRRIRHIGLNPEDVSAPDEVIRAIENSDLIVIGPGSLYTSVIPPLLVGDIIKAIARSHARVILVMNLMTEPGETDGYSTHDMVTAVRDHAPGLEINAVLMSNTNISPLIIERYARQGSSQILADCTQSEICGCAALFDDITAEDFVIRHDPVRLARAVLNCING